jgi:uncharacterized protein YjbJ (UPF0337 family)
MSDEAIGLTLLAVKLRRPSSYRAWNRCAIAPFSLRATEVRATAMDKDRIKGSAQQHKGAAKEGIGKMLGDEKMKAEGKMDKVEGKARNAIGSAKDAVRDAGKPKHH